MLIRAEEQRDWAAVHAVNVSAFETPAEANLVDALRAQAQPLVSLIAEDNDAIVGHIMFSPVSLSGNPALRIMGLAPMAVAPEHQRQGIGSALVRAGLDECKQLGSVPPWYGPSCLLPRFGFVVCGLWHPLRIRSARRSVHGCKAAQQIGPERRERDLIADFQLPIVDLIRAARSTLTFGFTLIDPNSIGWDQPAIWRFSINADDPSDMLTVILLISHVSLV